MSEHTIDRIPGAKPGPMPAAATASRLDDVIRDPSLRAAIGYWDSLRGGRVLPSRMELDPSALRPHLQNTAILEISRPGSVRIRLGGARVNALIGMDVRGLPVRALFDLSERAQVSDEIEAAIGTETAVVLDVTAPAPRFGGTDDGALKAQIAVLPMMDADLQPTRALYVMSPLDGTFSSANTPLRWYTKARHHIPLAAGRPVFDSAPALHIPRPAVPDDRSTVVQSEAQSDADAPLARARFRVIEGGLA